MSQKKVNLALLEKALDSLERASAQPKDEFIRDSVIQRFEYSFEISWKTLKKYFLYNQQLDEANVKNLFREAGKQGLIQSVEDWFEFHQARNLTSHTSSEKTAEEVYTSALKFLPAGKLLLKQLKTALGDF